MTYAEQRINLWVDDDGSKVPAEIVSSKVLITAKPLTPCPTIRGLSRASRDIDNSGLCSDTNGNGRLDFADVVRLFQGLSDSTLKDSRERLDHDRNGRFDIEDIAALFKRVLVSRGR
jgi:hypothetical protein